MRRILLILLAGLLLAPAALAAKRAVGDGTFAVRAGGGKVVVTARGTIFGQVGNGKIWITDPNPGDDIDAQVSGAERTRLITENLTLYSGKNIRFRFVGGRYAVTISGVGIDVSAVGKGTATLAGNPNVGDPGDYAVNGAKWQQLPLLATTFTFGAAG